jgi:hypothetical protein
VIAREIAWESEPVAGYVVCVYGDGTEPGDCYTRVGVDERGKWWADDGDDTDRVDEYGPYGTRDRAVRKAEAVAEDLHEGDYGEDADDMRERLLSEAAGEPDPDGEYCVYWESACAEDEHVVARYATGEAAEAAAALANEALHRAHPGGQLLCGHEVRVLDDGEWIEVAS